MHNYEYEPKYKKNPFFSVFVPRTNEYFFLTQNTPVIVFSIIYRQFLYILLFGTDISDVIFYLYQQESISTSISYYF